MTNCYILWKNNINKASFSGGNWSLDLSNISDIALSKIARSNSLALVDTKFTLSFSSDIYNKAIALINHNMSTTAKIKITATKNAGAITTYDSDWIDVYPSVYDSFDLEWEDSNWWYGRPTEDMLSGYTRNFIHIFPSNIVADQWHIEIDDSNSTNSYIDIGYAFLSPAWQPQRNYNFGSRLGFISRTRHDYSLGGSSHFDKQRSARKWEIDINNMSESESYSQIIDMLSARGMSDPVIFIPNPENQQEIFRQVFLATITDTSGITHKAYNLYDTHLVFRELLP